MTKEDKLNLINAQMRIQFDIDYLVRLLDILDDEHIEKNKDNIRDFLKAISDETKKIAELCGVDYV